ncbi:MAG TPA: DUF2914 domain-containing protein [Candidatus Paceibacterota bacterium]|nr:DUF2914 domain-containing protein [Candidatus Paceibacterota bacterium]
MEEKTSFFKELKRHARAHLMTVAFLGGFVIDNLTLNRVDQLFDNLILLWYIVLAMFSIVLLYAGVADHFGERTSAWLRTWMPVVMQYAFGGLLSGMLIFYGRSGSLFESWPFLILILGVIYGNETIKSRHTHLVYNLTIFFVGLFAYVVLVIPVLTGKMGAVVFALSGLLALIIMSIFFKMVEYVVPHFVQIHKRNVIFIIGLVYLVLNGLYFANVIPPIPLSMKHVGIYHNVVKVNESYKLTYEKPVWWEWYRKSDSTIHVDAGNSVYCFASVFAPSRLNTKIYHRWEYYDVSKKEWVQHARMAYDIAGGRGEGYRGYTSIGNFREGEWRCVVETERGQVIGQESFSIVLGTPDVLVSRIE